VEKIGIIHSKINSASSNIAEALIRRHGFEKKSEGKFAQGNILLASYSEEIVHIIPDFDADLFIYASTHRSAAGTPAFSAHFPGNWGAADLGGEPKTLNIGEPKMLKAIFQSMRKLATERNIQGVDITLEVDHHGPKIEKPILFAEIGSSEGQWSNKQYGELVADAIMDAIAGYETIECSVAFGVGGGHYAPSFSKLALETPISFSHMLPKYKVDEVDYETFVQGIERSTIPASKVLIDWKGLNQPQRSKIIGYCEKAGIKWTKA
jgi:D-aminoacyl-tRNA deacylase